MLLHKLTNVRNILEYLYRGLNFEPRVQCAAAIDFLEDAFSTYDPVKEFWDDQIELRGITFKDEEEKKKVIEWLDHWTTDSFDMLSDAIWIARYYAGCEEEDE